jgi:hypothetical protein
MHIFIPIRHAWSTVKSFITSAPRSCRRLSTVLSAPIDRMDLELILRQMSSTVVTTSYCRDGASRRDSTTASSHSYAGAGVVHAITSIYKKVTKQNYLIDDNFGWLI